MPTGLSSPLVPGEVALVGAGPGDPELLTQAAVKLLAACDVVVYDALVSDQILALVGEHVTKIYAGKRGGRPSMVQEDISQALVNFATAKKRVVRLKGGDAFVFGRGGEEARALYAAGIRFRIVPGITAGIAAPAMAGIPVTDRTVNSSIAFLTGHEFSRESRVNWPALVAAFPVMVFYMAARALTELASRLIDAGMNPNTPIAVIRNASLPDEETKIGSLIQVKNGDLQAESPAIIIVGDVVNARVPWKPE
jgi:uroporphyrin-III C-methyltransferase